MRTSDYNIYITTEDNDKFILVHGYTGAVDVVTRNIVDALRSQLFDDVDPDTLLALRKRGYITSQDSTEEQCRAAKLGEIIHRKSSQIHNFMFVITYDCNFRCSYCYEAGLSGKGNHWGGEVFTKELVEHAYNAIDIMEPSATAQKPRIMLYGGEPLLDKNKDIVEYIIETGKAKGYRFGAITNGYELEFFKEFLDPDTINFLQITIDGGKTSHNERRPHHLKGNTYDHIIDNIAIALDHGVNVSVRINVDRTNIDGIDEFTGEVVKKGWNTNKYFYCYASPVQSLRAADADLEMISDAEPCIDLSANIKKVELLTYLEKHLRKGNNKIVRIPHNQIKANFFNVFRNGGNFLMKSAFCGAHTGGTIFDPKGDIYTCWEFVGHERTSIGRFSPMLQINPVREKEWHNRTFYHLDRCRKCKYAFHCGGGCSSKALLSEGDLYSSFCDGFASLFQQCVRSAYHDSLADASMNVQ